MNFIMLFFCKQKTAYEMRISDWSSDVCSSDLDRRVEVLQDDAVLCAGGEVLEELDLGGPVRVGRPDGLEVHVARVVGGALGAEHHQIRRGSGRERRCS